MSVYSMILTGLMIGSGPERVSAEVEQRLDLRGEWQMTIEQNHVHGDFIAVTSGPELVEGLDIRDEGNGRVRLRFTIDMLGIYKQEGDCIIISCARVKDGWPTSFEKKKPYVHIILRRVKTGK